MEEDINFWHLTNHKLFSTLGYNQTKELSIISCFRRLKKGEEFYYNDFEEPRVFFLKKGNIKLTQIDNEGTETISEILGKGDLFGAIDNEESRNYSHYAKSLTSESIICSFYQKDFEKLLEKNPQLAISYTKLIGLKLKKMKNEYRNLFTKDANQRLAIFLLNWYQNEGKVYNGRKAIDNYLTQEDISHLICCSRQTTSHLMAEWEEKELIAYGRKEITLLNYDKIAAIVK